MADFARVKRCSVQLKGLIVGFPVPCCDIMPPERHHIADHDSSSTSLTVTDNDHLALRSSSMDFLMKIIFLSLSTLRNA